MGRAFIAKGIAPAANPVRAQRPARPCHGAGSGKDQHAVAASKGAFKGHGNVIQNPAVCPENGSGNGGLAG